MEEPRTPPGFPQSFEELSHQQLLILAREVSALYQEEHRLRKELEERNRELEQKVRELSALNRLFQEYLAQHYQMVQAFREALEGIQRLAQEAVALAERARAHLVDQPPPSGAG